jgi:hypothetical protein
MHLVAMLQRLLLISRDSYASTQSGAKRRRQEAGPVACIQLLAGERDARRYFLHCEGCPGGLGIKNHLARKLLL